MLVGLVVIVNDVVWQMRPGPQVLRVGVANATPGAQAANAAAVKPTVRLLAITPPFLRDREFPADS